MEEKIMVRNNTLYKMLMKNDIEGLRKALEDNIREESAKGNKGDKTKISILKRLFKTKKNEIVREFNSKAIVVEDGLYGFMDLTRIFYSKNDFGYQIAEKDSEGWYDLAKFINDNVDNPSVIRLNDDDIANINLLIQKNKNKGRWELDKPYVIEYDNGKYIGFNPQFLLDAIQFTDSKTLRINNFKTPCYISGEENYAIVLPVNVYHYDYDTKKNYFIEGTEVHKYI